MIRSSPASLGSRACPWAAATGAGPCTAATAGGSRSIAEAAAGSCTRTEAAFYSGRSHSFDLAGSCSASARPCAERLARDRSPHPSLD